MNASALAREEVPRLLKTCQTCYNLKMKCMRTQNSNSCNRCHRLGKICVFPRAKKRLGGRRVLSPRRSLQGRSDDDRSSRSGSPLRMHAAPSQNRESRSSAPIDPFIRGILSIDEGERLMHLFTTRMTLHFPFIMILPSMRLSQLHEAQPTLALAIMSVASYENLSQQTALVKLFREMISTLILEGYLNTLDVLQGLLVSVAWSHYQPRPNRHSAYLHLAIGIVTDMRLDCPTNMRPWQFFCKHSQQGLTRSSDELRALAGTYYLATSSSIVLLKRQHFSYTKLIFDSCQQLSQALEYPTDRFLPAIIQLQQLMRQVDDIVHVVAVNASVGEINIHIHNAQQKFEIFRMSYIASLHECPPLKMQMHMIDLLISQLLLPGFPFSVGKHQVHITSEQKLTECFSASTTAAKSLLSGLLVLPPGFEATLSNIEWIMVHYALSIAARLDVMTTDPRIDGTVRHMRRFLDFPLSLAQIIHRIESISSDEIDKDTGDRHTFFDHLDRAKAIEAWYLQQTGRSSLMTMPSTATAEVLEVPNGNSAALQLTTVDGGGSVLQMNANIRLADSTQEGNAPFTGMGAAQPQTVISGTADQLGEFSVMDFFNNLEDQGQDFGTFYGLDGY